MFFDCEICDEQIAISFREIHHVLPQSAGGKDLNPDGSSNTIAICATCHGTLHTIAVMLRGKKAGTVEDTLSYIQDSETKKEILVYAKEVNKGHVLKKDGGVNTTNKEEPISITLPGKYKKALKVIANETRDSATGRKMGVSKYIRALLLAHVRSKFPQI